MPKRHLSPIEKNHLQRFGFKPTEIGRFGEMPVEYITGWAIFLDQIFKVTSDTLIPRVETEELVELIQQALLKDCQPWAKKILTIADVGTGSGVIGISLARFLAQQHLSFQLTLSDLSAQALSLAQENLQQLLPTVHNGQVNFLLSDLLTSFPPAQQFDLIVANVPYVPRERILTLESSVRDFEPLMALDGGSDGLHYICLLLDQAKNILKPGGKLYLELDHTHTAEKFKQFAADYSFTLHNDQFGRSRFGIFILKKSR